MFLIVFLILVNIFFTPPLVSAAGYPDGQAANIIDGVFGYGSINRDIDFEIVTDTSSTGYSITRPTQGIGDLYFGAIGKSSGQVWGAAQSFKLDSTGNLTHFSVRLDQILGLPPIGTITWSLRTNNNNQPGSIILQGILIPVPESINTVPISNGPILNSNTTYWLVLESTLPQTDPSLWSWRGGPDDLPPLPWWQVVGADVTARGNLYSYIPQSCIGSCIPYLIKNSVSGGSSGVAIYGQPPASYDFSANLASEGVVSSKKWLVQNNISTTPFNYDQAQSFLPASMIFNSGVGNLNAGLVGLEGYIWHKYSGNLTIINSQNITNKVVLFVDGNVSIARNITISNSGFLLVVVSGDIIVDPSVTNIQGLLIADGQVRTGSSTQQLIFKGSVVGLSGFSFQRDLGINNSVMPAEVFEFEPSYLFLYPKILNKRPIVWREVAP